jgi:hypothetical protein
MGKIMNMTSRLFNNASVRSAAFSAVTLVISLILLMLMAAGCGGPKSMTSESATSADSQATSTAAATTTVTTTAAETTTAATTTAETTVDLSAPRSLLTGEPLKTGETAGERPIAIMINNIKVAVPQIGISQADLIYETQVEGGITRMMVVFSSAASIPELGSIRSARNCYIDLAGGLDAILVHCGASYLANDQFAAQKTSHIDLLVHSGASWRDEKWKADRGMEHSVKSNGELLQGALDKSGFRTEIRKEQKPTFRFRTPDDFQPADGPAAAHVTAPFSSYCIATFTYDADLGFYEKGEFGKPQIDLATGEPIHFTNVFLLQTSITEISPGAKLKAVDLRKGKGYYLSGGQYQEITWKKGETTDSFVFTDSSGNELLVNTGKTYVGILSKAETISLKP